MVVANNKIDETKNAGKSMTISMVMAIQRYDAGRIARSDKTHKTLTQGGHQEQYQQKKEGRGKVKNWMLILKNGKICPKKKNLD